MEHPDTVKAIANLAATHQNLGKYTKVEKLETQAYELNNKVPGAESPHTVTTMANVQKSQEIQVDAGSTVPHEENLHPTQLVLNHPVEAVLPDTIVNPDKKGFYLQNFCLNPPLILLSSVHFLSKFAKIFKI